ncbi:glycosyltransferase [Caballeronia ptereochthonis]|uniref:Glycosyl transferase family 2 n=1 Tax=Caballeronia ptereochthonis TaxID=1777144 RepID=A0A158BJQ4_9BURK|nr:glycosyltransferase [Caballeronia ptereochthonis]SAK69567.1 glycosyl transferase family 2 [Caballeronia ptereochthonis]
MPGLTVFVTRELFPFTPGGIGRVLANMLDAARSSGGGTQGTAVVFLGRAIDAARFAARFPGVLLVDASPSTYLERDEGFRYPPADQYTTHAVHADSVRAMQALKRLEREHGPLRYVEFPDWGAVAFASLQEKRLGLAFESATMAVRLHTSDSMLSATESKPVDRALLALYDLERKALADCDLVIGQVSATAQAMQTFFDFHDDEWLHRLMIDAPPVVLDHGASAPSSIMPDADTPIVFSSKIQRIKRPDVFVRGCSDFLRKHPEYRGTVHLMAMAPDSVYRDEIARLVPADLAHRFVFQGDAGSEARHELIRRSVCVFPNTFESFCLAAYEASLSGALCVVNRDNPAFADASPWVDGENCIKFDGTPADLSRGLTRAFATGSALNVARAPAHAQPWEAIAPREIESTSAGAAAPLVSVLVPHHNLGAYLEDTVRSALASDYANLEVVVVDDASTDAASIEVVERLAASGDPRVRVVRSPQNLGLAATRNVALAHARGTHALTLDADDLIDPRFISIAVKGLERNPEVSFVVPQTAYFDDAPRIDPARAPWPQCMTFVGEARASGLLQNRFSTATIMGRVDAFRSLGYDESLSAYEDWDMYMRAVMARGRFIVTNAVHFHYRRRAGSMIHSEAALRRIGLYYHDIVRRKAIRIGLNTLPMYVVEGAGGGESVERLRAQLAAYENSTVVKAALRVRALVSRLPKPVQLSLRRVAGFVRKARAARRG